MCSDQFARTVFKHFAVSSKFPPIFLDFIHDTVGIICFFISKLLYAMHMFCLNLFYDSFIRRSTAESKEIAKLFMVSMRMKKALNNLGKPLKTKVECCQIAWLG